MSRFRSPYWIRVLNCSMGYLKYSVIYAERTIFSFSTLLSSIPVESSVCALDMMYEVHMSMNLNN